jgi:hypothetical protein
MADATVYISYSRKDSFIAEILQLELERAGVTTVFDKNILKPGQQLLESLRKALDRAIVLVVLVSETSSQSRYVLAEVQQALKAGKQIVPLLLDDYDALEAMGLGHLYAPTIKSPSELITIIQDIKELAQPGLTTVIQTLHQRQFDENFVGIFRHLVTETPEDALTLHYKSNLELSDGLRIEQAINDIALVILSEADQIGDLARLVEQRQNIFAVTSFTHPASTEIILEFTKMAALALLASPDFRSFIIGLITNAVYDVAKGLYERSGNQMFAARKEGEWKEITSGEKSVVPPAIAAQIQTSVQTITSQERYFGIKGGRIVMGVETRSVETRLLQG